ncbi:MAG TPA: SUMF1/EgtB/PvdO family nonheme iron enzyme [Gemmataceae bacterium]
MAVQREVHPSSDVLKAFGLGKLDERSCGVVMNHLDQCEDCRKEVAALSGDDFLVRLRQAHSSSTPAPAKSLAEVAHAAKPSASQTAIPNLPPELAANPQYEILRELGRGGMGVVYLAHNKLMDRLEVLKVVNKALLDHPGAVERFLREIRAAAKLSHANVVTAHSAVQQGELLAFAMEYVEGQDLASLVKTQGPLPIANVCFYIQQAASGLQHAFEKQMVHRDIKPQNLILAREGKKHLVKVLDFGLAKVLREKTDDTGLTGEGKMLGTPDYIAPEQALDAAKADIRADIYSLGCTLYYLLSGRPPFSANSLGAILLAHQMQEAKPLNLVRPEVPEELAAVVRKMMAKSPAQRYQTPREVVQALAPFIKPGATPKPSPELSVETVEAKPTAKKAVRVDRAAAAEAHGPPEAEVAGKSPPEGGIPSAEPRRSERFSDGTIGSQLGPSIPTAAPQKSRTIHKRRPAVGMTETGKKWLIGSGIGGVVLLLALLGLWAGGVFKAKVKTADGEAFLVLKDLPAGAEVRVDGQTITVNVPGDNQPVEIKVPPGRHQLEVKKGGFKAFSETIELQLAEKSKPIQVTLEPLKPKTDPSEYVNSLGMKFRLIPAGKFLMGSKPSEIERCINLKLIWPRAEHFASEGPAHEVEITRPFYIGIHEVTVGQFRQFVKAMDYKTQAEKQGGSSRLFPDGTLKKDGNTNWRNPGFEQSDDHPVVCVSWIDAVAFCVWLSGKDGRKYRLPLEAEWEYSCRAKSTTRFCCGDEETCLKDFANLTDESFHQKWPRFPYFRTAWDDGYPFTAPVGQLQANAFGLHDMHGNVWEWCADWYDLEYYKHSPKQDPPGPRASGVLPQSKGVPASVRVIRGGSWFLAPVHCRSTFRNYHSNTDSSHGIGFRVVLLPAKREAKADAPSPSPEPAARGSPPPA